jgi:hypothetical protein
MPSSSDAAGGTRDRRPQWRFLARRPGGNWLHVYTSHKPTELEAVIEFGEQQPQCFWQMDWQVVDASLTPDDST